MPLAIVSTVNSAKVAITSLNEYFFLINFLYVSKKAPLSKDLGGGCLKKLFSRNFLISLFIGYPLRCYISIFIKIFI